MKNIKFLIIGICICIIALIVIYGSIYLILKDRIQTPFEDNKISYIKDNKDYARIVKNPINKIEISFDESPKIIENPEEINKVIASLNNCNGYKTSIVNVPLGPNNYIILFTRNSSLTLHITSETISINKTHYKTTINYLELLNKI